MTRYCRAQVGIWTIIMPVVLVLVAAGIVASDPQRPTWLLPAMLILAGVLLLFAKLTVEVGDGQVRCSFCFGLIARSVPMSEITSVSTVRNSWVWGWGIRKIPDGWMYNIDGLDAVSLSLKNGGVFRIGSAEPDALREAILAESESVGAQVES